MDRLGFFKHGLGRILETAQSMIGLKQAVNSFTEVVDEALSEIKSDMGLHLPTLDALVYENAEQAMQELQRMGFTAIEVGSYFFGKVHYKTPEEFRALADRYGLKITSAHLNHLYESPTPEEGAEQEGKEGTESKESKESAGGAEGAEGITKQVEIGQEGAGQEGAEYKEVEREEVIVAEGTNSSADIEPTSEIDPNDKWWREAIKAHKILGCKYITMQRMPAQMTPKDAEFYAGYFNRIGELCLEEGMKFQFHPTKELLEASSEHESLLDIIAAATDPEKVWLQIDSLECQMAKVDCLALIQRYADRVLTMHLHDYGTTGESGDIDFEELISKAIKLKVEELYIEVNNFTLPPINCVERSINNMMSLPSVRY
ncbi:MAG: TIM barrel protein [Alistipes sp.]|nr:TIM barrel protein [Alistipes sp.]